MGFQRALCSSCPIRPGLDKIFFFLKKFLFAKSIKARQFIIGSGMMVVPETMGSLLGILKNQI